MKRTRDLKVHAALLAVGLIPTMALAHHLPSDTSDFSATVRPLSSVDHSLAFTIVGLLVGVGLVAACILRIVMAASPRSRT